MEVLHKQSEREAQTKTAASASSTDIKMTDAKATYKSWKKKYRKMRIKFDGMMREGEDLHATEHRAVMKAKQLAIYNDRLLDILADVNRSVNVPPAKRFDIKLEIPKDTPPTLILDIDTQPPEEDDTIESLQSLITNVPHLDFAATSHQHPDEVTDLITASDSPALKIPERSEPVSFLTPDDIDNYLHEVDLKIWHKMHARGRSFDLLPSIPHLGKESSFPTSTKPNRPFLDDNENTTKSWRISEREVMLRNPTSVYNWLRKHAPRTFLQDAESGSHSNTNNGTTTEKSNGHHRHPDGEPKKPKGGGGGGSKRESQAASKSHGGSKSRAKGRSTNEDRLEDGDDGEGAWHGNNSAAAATGSGVKGKRKRTVDDDQGYRPKGGSSRPVKKKKKVAGGGGGTPTTAEAGSNGNRNGGGGGSPALKPKPEPKQEPMSVDATAAILAGLRDPGPMYVPLARQRDD